MYKLIITECINPIKLMRALRAFNPSFSLMDVKGIVDRIRNSDDPFIADDRFESPKEISKLFSNKAVWTYEEIPMEEDEQYLSPEDEEEQKLYTMARLWYNDLPKEDKQKVDILIRNSMPFA